MIETNEIPKQDSGDRLIDIKEFAALIGSTPGSVRTKLCKKQLNIPIVRMGRLIRIRLMHVWQLIEQNTHAPK